MARADKILAVWSVNCRKQLGLYRRSRRAGIGRELHPLESSILSTAHYYANHRASSRSLYSLCYNFPMRVPFMLLLGCCLFPAAVTAQRETSSLPKVTTFECPAYPSMAASMRIIGTVKLQITTDGQQVVDVKLTSGHPVLAQDSVKNVRTWKFADHVPTTFEVTYRYVNEGEHKRDKVTKCSAKMELPTTVTVSRRF
jgi:hypothetical protein